MRDNTEKKEKNTLTSKSKWIISAVAGVLVVAVGVGSYIYLSNKWAREAEDNEMAQMYANRFSVTADYAKQKKEELGDWDTVGYRLMQEEHMFTPERATELYRKGYLVEDMEKAQQLEVDTGVDREIILEKRGAYPGQLPWKEVIKELKLDTRSDAEKLGLSKSTIKLLKKNGLDESKIIDVAIKVSNGDVTEKEVAQEIKNGSSIDDLLSE